MSTTGKAYHRIGRRSSKSRKPVRTLSKTTNIRAERQKNFRYHHYAERSHVLNGRGVETSKLRLNAPLETTSGPAHANRSFLVRTHTHTV
jgi:hypothetical protein